ncbi:TrpB-like pyridoxal phosphate-dependent enzyme [Solirubrobacter ginsenosidimutans]|uniref:Tryptophan synthase beta chain n=1 Tax=Solirubrobacter ginsenosidimutans TaxID=490573 RepID=A0A9X3MY24_9ACTN|nr:TrpB-like pyridoxal phosphate-dependent enzyme [Solirubrobacter ginsenosidimutans]MDA0164905.1 TrpB-like pyridoxal phosphate-dependent enzyme [Solirubrobacter ginsenosidimutans]
MSEPTKFVLDEDAIPTHWVNLLPDLPGEPLPPLNPQTGEPAGPPDLTPIFPMGLIMQEVSPEPEVAIPDAVRDAYRLWRPTPLYRAHRLEQALGTPAKIFYKYEGVSPTGSHKPNSAVPQAYENAQAGITKLVTETGAGQWGSSLAFACSLFGLECEVFMVGSSYDQKPYRRSMMQTWGATVHRSPSALTESGKGQASHPTGSLGIAISEAVEVAAQREDTNYALGSVLNHVLLHQTVIGQEAILQLDLAGAGVPDVIVGCVGGGSNFAGLVFPFIRATLRGENSIRYVAAEPAACPTLTRGVYAYDFGDTVGLTPLMPMHTLGHDFVPPPLHAGGLRYHGAAPMISGLVKAGVIEARAYRQNETFEAAVQFARTEGIIPAPESAHAIRGAIVEALAAKEAGEERTILFGLSGHGNFDLAAYDAYLGGTLEDPEFSEEDLESALAALPANTPAIA